MSNHIANKIEAKDKSLGKIFLNERYKIDVFQREYRWQRRHIEALISDLSISFLNSYKAGDTIEKYDLYDSYYMGPIVLCNDQGSLSIVDGQQRLTSFTLLLIYLSHLQESLNLSKNLLKDFRQFIYVTKGGKTTLVLDIAPREQVMRMLFENPEEISEEISQDESVNNIIARYEDITKLFPEEITDTELLPLFIEWLLEKVVLVEVKAFSMENAYTIFETMNDRGMNLSPTEMLKGYLLSKVTNIDKSFELNEFWKDRIAELKVIAGSEADLEFFRAWLRAKYAETKRTTKQGSANEDFELIGTQFHAWIKKNTFKAGLITSDDFYFFVRSEFDYFTELYKVVYEAKTRLVEGHENIYISNFFTIADSLAYPLFLSPVTKLDNEEEVEEKVDMVGKFIDVYTNLRSLSGKTVTQSSIRSSMYELVKSIRNLELEEMRIQLTSELEKSVDILGAYTTLHKMDNWGYYHYFFARILFHLNSHEEDFSKLLRSRKQNSYVLIRILDEDDNKDSVEEIIWNMHINSVAGYCLVRRYDLEEIYSRKSSRRINYMIKQRYFPEMNSGSIEMNSITSFLNERDFKIGELVKEIWNF